MCVCFRICDSSLDPVPGVVRMCNKTLVREFGVQWLPGELTQNYPLFVCFIGSKIGLRIKVEISVLHQLSRISALG